MKFKSFLLSVCVHVIVISFVVLSIHASIQHISSHHKIKNATPNDALIDASAINEADVEQKVEQIKQQQNAKEQRQLQLQRDAEKAIQHRKDAEQQLNHLKQQQQKLRLDSQTEQTNAKKQLSQLQQLQAAAEQRLTELQSAAEKLNQKNQQLSQQLQKTQSALNNAASKQEKAQLSQQLGHEKMQQQSIQQAQMNNTLSRYKTLILNAIGHQWIIPPGVDHHLSCVINIQLAKNGEVLDAYIARSSGNQLLDKSAITAVYKASPLPVPKSNDLFNQFEEFQLTVRPEGLIHESLD